MRSTQRTLLITGGFAAGSSAMIATGAVLYESQGETALTGSLIFIGLMIAPVSIIWFLSALVSGARKEALEQGKGEIARWTLSAAEWSAFRAQESRMTSQGRHVNILNLRREPRDGEVIFAKRGVIVDEDYHDLTPGGLADLRDVEFVSGSPSYLEFSMRSQKGRGASGTGIGFNYMWLRVPVAPSETRESMKVLAHYKAATRRAPSIAMKNPKLTLRICIGIAIICAIAAIWGFANRETRDLGDAPLYAAVIGVIAGLGALLLAAIVSYRVRVGTKS